MLLKENLEISIIQYDIKWEAPQYNLNQISELIKTHYLKTDIVVLPEMFTTGFTMNPSSIDTEWKNKTIEFMKLHSAKGKFAICGSIVYEENNTFYNRFIWVNPEGETEFYDKRHLFRMGGENNIYQFGTKKAIINYKGWRIAPFICYDLRFPAWSRNTNTYDIAIYVANWPASRAWIWKHLLVARAIENQCIVVGANRVGLDAQKLQHNGDSMIIDSKGQIISDYKSTCLVNQTCSISHNDLINFRNKFPVLKDADTFDII